MIDKTNGNVSSLKAVEENEIDVPNFKLLYRNMRNLGREKSSAESSDEETTSSSLIPIPDSLRQMKNKLSRTLSDTEHSESPHKVSEVIEKPAEALKNSLEELRKKYTLKTETSVALKMNSANLILDDILNSANLNVTANENLQIFKQQEIKSKILSENETSTTESSVSVMKHYPHIIDHSHPVAYEFFTPSCPRHGNFAEPLHNSLVKGPFISEEKVETPKRKKTLMEIIQDFQIKGKIQSVYRSLQRTRNPFAKDRRESKLLKIQQGIPGVRSHQNGLLRCKCNNCPKKQQSKVRSAQGTGQGLEQPLKYKECTFQKLNLDLLQSSELSQSESKGSEWDDHHCTCFSQRECDCPEVIPVCNCAAIFRNISENSEYGSSHADVQNIINDDTHETQCSMPAAQKKESEISIQLPKEKEEKNNNIKQEKNSELKKHSGESKMFSKERRIIERTDIYYFDHGNSAYYQTTDNHPLRFTECLVERTDHFATKFWAEIFGTLEIGVAFLITFLLQFYRFLFTSIIRSLTIGLLQISSDYFIKPFLTIIFNGFIQPFLILGYNVATSVRDLCLPISQMFGFFTKELAGILRSCRIVEINHEKQTLCHCGNKV